MRKIISLTAVLILCLSSVMFIPTGSNAELNNSSQSDTKKNNDSIIPTLSEEENSVDKTKNPDLKINNANKPNKNNKNKIDFSPLKHTKKSKYNSHKLTQNDVENMKKNVGIRDPNKNYNIVYDGHGTGLAPPSDEEYEAMIGNVEYVESTHNFDLPNYLDHSTSFYFPAVGNQLSQGSCAAWATTYYIAGYLQAKDNYWFSASQGTSSQILSPSWTYNKINGGVDSGSNVWSNHYIMQTLGGSTMYNMPYNEYDYISWGSEKAWREAPLNRVGNLSQTDSENIDVIKSWLNDGYICYMGINSSMYNVGLGSGDDTINSTELTSYISNHANTIVGYSDSKNDDSEVGGFKVVNSWGSSWGSSWNGDGFYWITYEAFINLVSPVSMFYDKVDYEPSLLATLNFSGDCSKDSFIYLGIGNYTDPIDVKYLWWYAGEYNYPNFMSIDITEFKNYIGLSDFFINIGSGKKKTSITSFKLEYHEYYYSTSGICQSSGESPEVPRTNPCILNNSFKGFYVELDTLDENKYYGGNVTLTGNASYYIDRTILYEDFESEFPGDWIVGDSEDLEGYDYWGNTTYRAESGFSSAWCAQIQEPLYEQNFNNDGAIPSGWTTFSSGNDSYPWTMNNTAFGNLYGGPNFGAVCDSDSAGPGKNINEWLYMTESFNASNASSLYLEFYLEYEAFLGIDEFAEVLYCYDPDYPTFTSLKKWTSDTKGKQQLDLSDAAGKNRVYLAFLYNATYDHHMFVDDVRVLTGIKTNNHTNKMDAFMYRSVDLTEYDQVDITYDYWIISENSYDHLYVLYYQDGQWKYVDPKTGNSYGWRSSYVSIPTNATSIGFFFESDTFVYYEGAYVDNVEVTGVTFLDHTEVTIDTGPWNITAGGGNWSYELDVSGYLDGEHNISVRAKYNDLYSYDLGKIKIDHTPPLSFTPTPDPASWTINSQPTVTFSTIDALSGIDHYQVSIDDSTFYSVTSPYKLPPINDGTHKVTIRAFDKAGNYRDNNTNVYIDCSKPDHFIPTVDPDGWTSETRPEVSFSTLDSSSGIDRYDVKVGSGNYNPRSSPYKLPALNTGIHTVYIRAFDNAGNYVDTSVEVFIDTEKPIGLLITADPDIWTNDPQPIITFAATDLMSDLDHYEVKIDDGDPGRQTSPYKLPPLADGTHSITVRACDKAGNFIEDNISVHIDTTPPEPFTPVTYPDGWSRIVQPTITFSTSDATSGMDRYEVSIDGGGYSIQSSPYILAPLDDGTHIITIRGIDNAGNYVEETIAVYIDTTKPSLFTPSANPGTWTSNNRPEISFSTTDADSGIDNYQISIDGSTASIQSSPYKLPPLSDGEHEIIVTAYDKAGNYNSGTVSVFIDTLSPQINVNNITDNAWYNDQNITINWICSDQLSDLDDVMIGLDDGPAINKGDVKSHIFTGLVEGDHTFKITAYDNAQNMNYMEIKFKIDHTKPGIKILEPAENKYYAQNSMEIKWEGSDILSGIGHYTICLNNGVYINVNTLTSHSFTDLKDGQYSVSIKAFDLAGNSEETTTEFSTDTTKPDIQTFVISTIDYDHTEKTIDINSSWHAEDTGSGIGSVMIKLDDDDYQNASTTEYHIFNGIELGIHTFFIKVTDNVGNTEEFYYKTRIDPLYEGTDTDSDGLPDDIDPDDDNDGYSDQQELEADTDPLDDSEFPKEQKESTGEESDKFGFTEAGIIIIIILLVLILVSIFFKRGKEAEFDDAVIEDETVRKTRTYPERPWDGHLEESVNKKKKMTKKPEMDEDGVDWQD